MSAAPSDDDLVDMATSAAVDAENGRPRSAAYLSTLTAIAETRAETRRHELAAKARARTEQVLTTVGAIGLGILRAIFRT